MSGRRRKLQWLAKLFAAGIFLNFTRQRLQSKSSPGRSRRQLIGVVEDSGIYINCGELFFPMKGNGKWWQPDFWYAKSGSPFKNSLLSWLPFSEQAVFQSYRKTIIPGRPLIYEIPVDTGRQYSVKLYFAKLQRIEELVLYIPHTYDVFMQGKLVFDKLPVVYDNRPENTGGAGYSFSRTAIVNEVDGKIGIEIRSSDFPAYENQPSLAAIEIHDVTTVSPAPTTSPAPTYAEQKGDWIQYDAPSISPRHEACFTMVGRKAYLVGGRGLKDVDIWDPVTKSWSKGKGTPIELHHFQCVGFDDKIWIVSSWTGNYPKEDNVGLIYVYDTLTDEWSTREGLPPDRQRGGGAAILDPATKRIYLSHGNVGGHEEWDFAESVGWLDYYDIEADSWITNLPDAPNPRDHVGGALVNGDTICVAGGRLGGEVGWWYNPVLVTDCFDIPTQTWRQEALIPTVGRAGASYGTSCDGHLLIAGGEGFGQAYKNFDLFDGTSWRSLADLNTPRHGSGLAVDCVCGAIYIASGAGMQAGNNELPNMEIFYPDGIEVPCTM